jgi:hypothetical protein
MPLSKQIHEDKALEKISIEYKPGEFIADKLVPAVPVKHDTDKYYVYDFGAMRLEETKRAKGAPTNRTTYTMSTSSYSLDTHALKELVLVEDKNNADKAINLEIDTTESLTRKILIRKEKECNDVIMAKANWTNNESLTSTLAWTQNTTLSNPITKVDSATSKIISSSGYKPNVLAMDDATFRGAKEHTSIIDRVKYTSADSVTEQMLAKLFNIDQVLIGRAIYESAQEGLTSSPGSIWTNSVYIAYHEKSPGLKKASGSYQLFQQNMGMPHKVTKWAEDDPEGTWIKVETKFQFKPVATACSYLLVDAT